MTKIFLKKKNYKAQVFLNSEQEDKLSIELQALEFSSRTINSLSDQGIKTLGELVVYDEHDLRTFPGMGSNSIEEIKKILNGFSLYLGMNLNILKSEQNESLILEKNKEWNEISRTLLLELIKDFNEIPLSIRAKNALLNLGCNYVGDIISIDKAELRRVRSLGYKSILEIDNYLTSLNLNFGDQLDPWDNDIIVKLRQDLRKQLSETKKDELIHQDKLLEVELKRVLSEAAQLSKKDNSHKDKVIDIINSRFGLDGSPSKTLEIIGQKYNVTRERIRQNESYGLRKIKFLKPITPILDKTFKLLEENLPLSEIEFNEILKKNNISKLEWDLKGLKDFYESFGKKLDFTIVKINGVKLIHKINLINIFRILLIKISKEVTKSGLVCLTECLKIKEVSDNNLREETLRVLVQTKPLFVWLDDNKEWFSFHSKRNRLSNLISKAATVSKSLDADYLFKRIKNHYRLGEVLYDKNVFLNFCLNSFDCKLENNLIKFNSTNSKLSSYKGYKGTPIAPNEQKIVEVFNKFGPILNWQDLKELSQKCDVSEYSLNMMMQFSVMFQRIDTATYMLSGAKFNKDNKKVKIDLMSKSYKKKDCNYIENEPQYFVEIYKLNKYIKTIAYPRMLMKISETSKGVFFEDKVYPVIFI